MLLLDCIIKHKKLLNLNKFENNYKYDIIMYHEKSNLKELGEDGCWLRWKQVVVTV